MLDYGLVIIDLTWQGHLYSQVSLVTLEKKAYGQEREKSCKGTEIMFPELLYASLLGETSRAWLFELKRVSIAVLFSGYLIYATESSSCSPISSWSFI